MRTAVIVLASGLSRRFGPEDKLLANLKGQALLAYCLDTARHAGFDALFAVCPDPDPRADLARSFGFSVINNPNPLAGQGASLALGAGYLIEAGFNAACILLGDMPMITAEYLNILKAKSTEADIVFSRIDNRVQPPSIFRGEALKILTELSGDQGARSLGLSKFRILYQDIEPEMACDFDSEEDFNV